MSKQEKKFAGEIGIHYPLHVLNRYSLPELIGLAETAYVLERGRIHYHGTAQRLKDEPQLLQSAYLLREVDSGGDALETVT